MGELLQNILSLRYNINNLTELSNGKVYEYCELAIKIADTEEEIENMKVTKDNLEESIMDFKLKKGILFTWPIGAIFSLVYFTFLMLVVDKVTIGSILFTAIGHAWDRYFLGKTGSRLSEKDDIKALYKKYPELKEINDKLNNLIVRNRIVENNLKDIKKQKEEIVDIVTNYEEIIESKKGELNKLEQEYFNNFNNINNPSVTNSTTYEFSNAGKKRTRTIGESK